ncbi:MAG: class I SAM-dependent methyltransferase [Oscillospiraceae bacterium]|jgi:ubiquinone/menaquinone biosynthesis C-methylase UbiE|nr:class I SAM-dependent methyltransferase [Oscillospiraceae bacterium]
MDNLDAVRRTYDDGVEREWHRAERHPVEFEINRRFIGKYVKPGDRVLDLGGGPGRYSLWLAESGCRATLADLSPNNVAFARNKSRELGLPFEAVECDARDLSRFADNSFDHVLCMGPLYHLKAERDREATVRECLRVLKSGGTLSAAFISSYSGVLYYLKSLEYTAPAILNPDGDRSAFEVFLRDTDYSGFGFSDNYFARHADIVPWLNGFGLQKLHFLASEGILEPYEDALTRQSPEVLSAWIGFAEQVCEREDLLSFAEHYLYIGRKP